MKSSIKNRLNIFIQYPICDIRPLLSTVQNQIKPLPVWDDPVPSKHFVQYFGHLKRRKKGGHDYFHDELFFINGRGGFKFPKLEKVTSDQVRQLECIFRRLLNDGKSSIRYEVGLTSDHVLPTQNCSKFFKNLIEHICHIPVQIKNLEKRPVDTSVIHCGKRLSSLYEKASSQEYPDLKHNFTYVREGEMCMLLEYHEKDYPFPAKHVEVGPGLKLSFDWQEVDGKDVGIFYLAKGTDYDLRALRKIRIGIMRTYSEHQNLTNVLSYVRRPDLEFDTDKLSHFLNDKTGFFKKKNEIIKNLVLSYYNLIKPEEIKGIEKKLDQFKLQVKKKIYDHLGDASLQYSLGVEEISQVKKVVSQLISKDKTMEAIEILKTTISKLNDAVLTNDVTGIEARFHTLQRALINGTLGYNEFSIAQNKLRLSILTLASLIGQTQATADHNLPI